MTNIVICGYARSAFTPARKGQLYNTRPDDMAAMVIKGLIEKTGVNAQDIEDIKLGCAFPEAEQGFNMGRLVNFIADLPLSVAGVTTNRFCGSSMQTIHDAAGAIALGAGEVFIAAGAESMTKIPMTGFNPLPNPALYETHPAAYESMGITAENLAAMYKISRESQEEFAVNSHKKAAAAQEAGKFDEEIIEVENVTKDGCIRPNSNAKDLAELRPAFDKNGTVTAATSSPLTDGASAVLVASETYADANNLPKIARIKATAVAGCKPEIMGIGPVGASKKALERASLTLNQIDIIELNEAFSAQSMAVIKDMDADITKINIDGGAIAIGHPLGASGARITGKAASLLQRENAKYALATMCIGGGMGIATVLERI